MYEHRERNEMSEFKLNLFPEHKTWSLEPGLTNSEFSHKNCF